MPFLGPELRVVRWFYIVRLIAPFEFRCCCKLPRPSKVIESWMVLKCLAREGLGPLRIYLGEVLLIWEPSDFMFCGIWTCELLLADSWNSFSLTRISILVGSWITYEASSNFGSNLLTACITHGLCIGSWEPVPTEEVPIACLGLSGTLLSFRVWSFCQLIGLVWPS